MFCHDCICDSLCPTNTRCPEQLFEFLYEVESNENQGNLNGKYDNFPNSLLCLVISILASISCYKTYRIEKRVTFELLPLLINTLTSLFMLGFYIQMNPANADLYLFIVEFYSYFILCFGFIMIVIKQSATMRTKIPYLCQ